MADAPPQRRRLSPWVVVQTKPRQELWAAENVARQGAQYYLPRMSSGECLFPGYLFVRTPGGRWRFLLGTFGVLRVVVEGIRPARLRESEVEALRAVEGPDGFVRLPELPPPGPQFEAGEMVRVQDGPMVGLDGLVAGQSGETRVRVLMQLLGGETPVLIDAAYLEKLGP